MSHLQKFLAVVVWSKALLSISGLCGGTHSCIPCIYIGFVKANSTFHYKHFLRHLVPDRSNSRRDFSAGSHIHDCFNYFLTSVERNKMCLWYTVVSRSHLHPLASHLIWEQKNNITGSLVQGFIFSHISMNNKKWPQPF